MRILRYAAVAVIASCFAVVALSAAEPYENMLPTEGAFRRDFDVTGATWEEWGTGTSITNSLAFARSGTRSCRLADPTQTVTEASPADREIASATMTVVTGAKYCAAIWVFVNNEGAGAVTDTKFRLKIRWYDASNGYLSEDKATLLTVSAFDTWQRLEISSRPAPANATQARFTIHAHEAVNNNNDAYLDDGEFFSLPGEDVTPPGKVTGFTAAPGPGNGQITLSWVSPGNDGYTGNLPAGSTFYIQYASWAAVNFSLVSPPPAGGYHIWIPTGPVVQGSTRYRAIESLTPNVTYYFRIWARDNAGNWSAISDGATTYAKYLNTGPPTVTFLGPSAGAIIGFNGAVEIEPELDIDDPDDGPEGLLIKFEYYDGNEWVLVHDFTPASSPGNYSNFDPLTGFGGFARDAVEWNGYVYTYFIIEDYFPGTVTDYKFRATVKDSGGLTAEAVTGDLIVDQSSPVYSDAEVQRIIEAWVGIDEETDDTTPNVRLRVRDIHAGLIVGGEMGVNSNTLGLWHFNGDLNDSTADNHWGSRTGGGEPVYGTGRYGQAVVFDGAYGIQTNGDVVNIQTTQFSMGCWVWLDENDGTTARTIMRDGGAGSGYQLQLNNGGTANLAFRIYSNDTEYKISFANSGNSLLPLNTWNYIYATYSGGSIMRLYVNGQYVGGLTNVPASVPDPGNTFYIGCSYEPGEYFLGKLDEVFVSKSYYAGNWNYWTGHRTYWGGGHYSYSTDAGSAWSPWIPTHITGAERTTDEQIQSTIEPVPFNNRLENQNLIKFRSIDWINNIRVSDAYVVKIETSAPEAIPPANVSDLAAFPGTAEGTVRLYWTSPGDDGDEGVLVDALYRIKYTTAANIADFDSPPSPSYDWYVSTTNVLPGTYVGHTISGLLPGNTYYFAVITRDDAGNWSSWSIDGVNADNYCEATDLTPAAPQNLAVNFAADNSVQLSWTASVSTDIDYYEVFCDSTTPYDWTNQFIATATKNTSFDHTGLTNNVTYYYRVKAVDLPPKVLYSNYSNEVSTFPKPILPPAPSVSIDASGTTNSQIKWVLTDNAVNETNLYISSTADTGARLWSSVGLAGSGGTTSWTETGFGSPNQAATRYGEAKNAQGSLWSEAFTGYTRATAPTGLAIVSSDRDKVSINWNPNGNPGHTAYEISYSKDNFAADFSTPVIAASHYTASTVTIGGLNADTTYYFRARAFNGNGIETSFTAVKSTMTQAAAYILDENFDGGASYPPPPEGWLENSTDGATTSKSSPYAARFNAAGDWLITPVMQNPGTLSYWMYATPGASNFIVEYAASQADPTFTAFPWSPTTTDYGGIFKQEIRDISGYGNICIRFRRGDGKTYTLDGIKVTAPSPDLKPPSAVSNLAAAPGNTDGALTLRWSAPSDDYDAIKMLSGGYIVKYSSLQMITSANFAAPTFAHWAVNIATSGVATGAPVGLDFSLTPGVTYYFAIKSTDAAGNLSAWNSSADYPAVNAAAFAAARDLVPPPPSGLALNPSGGAILIIWNDVAITDLDYYQVFYTSSPPYNFSDNLIATTTRNTSFVHTGLINHVTYYYKVRAVDTPPVVLYGDFSSQAGTFPRISLPLPSSMGHDPAYLTSAQIRWVLTDNSTDETALYISSAANTGARLTGNLGPLSGSGLSATWTQTVLTPNSPLTSYGEAVNALGSSWSQALTVYTKANTPSGLTVSETTYDAAYLTWSANGNPSGTRYEVSYSNDNFATHFSTPINFSDNHTGISAAVDGLEDSRQYYFRVRAYNADGIASSFGATVSAVTKSLQGTQSLVNPSFESGLSPWNNVVNLDGETNPVKRIWQINNTFFTVQPDGDYHGFMEYGSASTGWVGIAAEQTGLNVSGGASREITLKYYMRNQYNSWGSATGGGAIVEIEFESEGTKKLRIYYKRKYTSEEDNPADTENVKYLLVPGAGATTDTVYCSYGAWGVEYSTGISSLINQKFGITDFAVKAVRLGVLARGGPTTVRMAFDNVRLISPPDTTPPAAISNLTALTASSSEGGVMLNWTAPGDDGLTGKLNGYYRIKYSTSTFPYFSKNDSYNLQFATSGATPGEPVGYLIVGLNPGTTYYFAVIARDDEGNWSTWTKGAQTNTANFAAALDLPPGHVRMPYAEGKNRGVTLSWLRPLPDPGDIDKYWVYMATFPFNSVTAGNVMHMATAAYTYQESLPSVAIGGLTNEVSYYFRIKTIDKGDEGSGLFSYILESALSATATGYPRICPPAFTSARHYGDRVDLTWGASPDSGDDNFGGYNIYRSSDTAPSPAYTMIAVLASGTTHQDVSSIDASATYLYYLTTIDTAGSESAPSNIKTASPDSAAPLLSVLNPLANPLFVQIKGSRILFNVAMTETESIYISGISTPTVRVNFIIAGATSPLALDEVSGVSYISGTSRIMSASFRKELGALSGDIDAALMAILAGGGTFYYYFSAEDESGNEAVGDTAVRKIIVAEDPGSSARIVAADGGTVALSDGNPDDGETSVAIPPGALTTDTVVALRQLAKSSPEVSPAVAWRDTSVDVAKLADGLPIAVYKFEPGGTIFAKPVNISLLYFADADGTIRDADGAAVAGVTEADSLRIFWWDGVKWVYVGGQLDRDKNTVTADVGHFSVYAVFPAKAAPEKPSASLKFVTPNITRDNILNFEGDGADYKEITIYDINGRIVRKLGPGYNFWDVKDDSGKIVEIGAYIWRAEYNNGKVNYGTVVVVK